MAAFIVIHSIKVATDFEPETFGRLTTIGPRFRLPDSSKYRIWQVCQCECGTVGVYRADSLRSQHTESCGCSSTPRLYPDIAHHTSIEYRAWISMKSRCYNKNTKAYADYGGRGIRVCDRWLEPNGMGFINFLADLGRKPTSKHTLDRIDVNGRYSPENCIWATRRQQQNNRRCNILITVDGLTKTLTQWAEYLGVPYSTLQGRLRLGWDHRSVITTPIRIRS